MSQDKAAAQPIHIGSTVDAELSMSIEDMAGCADRPAWMVARGVARLIAHGLLDVQNGTRDEAIAALRSEYGDAVNGK